MRVVQFTAQSRCRVLREKLLPPARGCWGIAHTPDRSPYELGVKV